MQHALAEGRRVGRDQVERHRGHHHQQRARAHQAPVLAHRAEDLAQGRTVLALLELLRLLQRAADDEQERHDQAADQERHAPAPLTHFLGRELERQQHAQQRGEHHRHLLAGRLPAHEEALAAGRRDFRQVDRHPAQLHAGREALQQAADQHQQRRRQADGVVARHQRDQQRAAGHQPQRHDQAGAAAVAVDVGAQDQRAQRPHQEADAEGHQRQHQREELVVGREEGVRDGLGVVAVDHEVVHLQEVTADHPEDGTGLGFVGVVGMHGCLTQQLGVQQSGGPPAQRGPPRKKL